MLASWRRRDAGTRPCLTRLVHVVDAAEVDREEVICAQCRVRGRVVRRRTVPQFQPYLVPAIYSLGISRSGRQSQLPTHYTERGSIFLL